MARGRTRSNKEILEERRRQEEERSGRKVDSDGCLEISGDDDNQGGSSDKSGKSDEESGESSDESGTSSDEDDEEMSGDTEQTGMRRRQNGGRGGTSFMLTGTLKRKRQESKVQKSYRKIHRMAFLQKYYSKAEKEVLSGKKKAYAVWVLNKEQTLLLEPAKGK